MTLTLAQVIEMLDMQSGLLLGPFSTPYASPGVKAEYHRSIWKNLFNMRTLILICYRMGRSVGSTSATACW